MNTAELKSKLIRLAGDIVMAPNIPSTFPADYPFTQRTPRKLVRRIIDDADLAESQCKRWAVELRKIADSLK